MEKMTNQAARRYLRQVRQLLPCSRREKNELTSALRQSLSEYLSEHPNATSEAIQTHFGTPESVAAMCMETTELPSLLKRIHIRRRILTIIVAAVIAILLTWGGFLLYLYTHVQKDALGGYDILTITNWDGKTESELYPVSSESANN